MTESTENVASAVASVAQVEEPKVQINVQSSTVVPVEKTYTQVEQEEMARGWKPDGKKSAEEFRSYREEYNNSLDRLKSDFKDQKNSIDFLLKQNAKLAEEGYQRALRTLRTEQEEAALIGDVTTVNRKTEEIVRLSKETPAPAVAQEDNFDKQPYLDFIAKHKTWYVTPGQTSSSAKNTAMSEYANKREEELRTAYPDMDARRVLDLLEDDLRITFPGLLKENSAPSVMTKSRSTSNDGALAYSDLSDFHKQMIEFNKANVKGFDEATYIKTIQQTRNNK